MPTPLAVRGATVKHWFRLAVDLDSAGNVVGASYEVHDVDGDLVTFGTVAVGPFDGIADAMALLDSFLAREYGLNFPLF